MAFSETPRFPDTISQGAVGGPEFKTLVSINDGGFEQRLGRWQFALYRYDVAHGVKDQADLDVLYSFFVNKRGMLTGFRFKDWSDYIVVTARSSMVYIALGVFQLGKTYTTGAASIIRDTKKVVDTTYSIYRNTVLQTEGTGAGEYSIDITTGKVTFVRDFFGTISGATNANPCVLTAISHGRTTGDEIEIKGVGGTIELNGNSYTITVLTPDTFSLDGVDSSAYGVFTGNGTWEMFPQTSETLTWAGEFDVPVRFDSDQMQVTIESYNNFSWGQIPLVELR